MTGPITGVPARLAAVRERITRAGGDDGIRVIAVTKGFGAGAVEAALAAGLTDVGENYADELLAKRAEVAPAELAAGAQVRWHFLGRVQRNKVRKLAPAVHLWQAVDRLAAGEAIARLAPGARVLVQVNVAGEPQKHGCTPDDAPALVDSLHGLGLDVAGLMTVGPRGTAEDARGAFRAVSALADRLHLRERSMGMTDDLETAVQEGATMVRVGRALFGPRNLATDLRR
ncbi:MAG: dependent protein [Actinomycetota bacterium]|nr:dependent protein [Actinomycetota bacterium]